MNIELTINEVIGDTKTELHHDVQEVPPGLTLDKTVLYMLSQAGQKFFERSRPSQSRDIES